MAEPPQGLADRAAAGESAAQHELASWYYANGAELTALNWLGRAAKSGSIPAIVELGARTATGLGASRAPEDGARLLAFATSAGSGAAARALATLYAAGLGVEISFATAWRLLTVARSAGDLEAADEIELVRAMIASDPAPWSEIEWRQWIEALPPAMMISKRPRVGVVAGFLPEVLCAHLIARAAPRIERAGVTDRRSGAFSMDPARTNGSAQVKLFDMGLPLLLLRARIAQLLGVEALQCEPMNVLCYLPGEQFASHHDYFDPAEAGFDAEIAQAGQRIATLLIYLNTGYSGGETNFPLAGLSHRAATGDALFFFNVDSCGRPDTTTLHEGRPTRDGQKWVLSQWVRDRPFPQQ